MKTQLILLALISNFTAIAQTNKLHDLDSTTFNKLVNYIHSSYQLDPVKAGMLKIEGYGIVASKNILLVSSDTSPYFNITEGNNNWIKSTRVKDGLINAMNTLKINTPNTIDSILFSFNFEYRMVYHTLGVSDNEINEVDEVLKKVPSGMYKVIVKTYTVDNRKTIKVQIVESYPNN